MPHWQGVFTCTGFQCTIVEGHSVKVGKREGAGSETLAAKMLLSVTKTIC